MDGAFSPQKCTSPQHTQVGEVHTTRDYLSWSATNPGRSRPSSISRDAPPPVEIWVIWFASPAWLIAATESPPPIMEIALLAATAFAIPIVPSAKRGNSKTPMGPFQTIVPAELRILPKLPTVVGPISKIRHPSGTGPIGMTLLSASASK